MTPRSKVPRTPPAPLTFAPEHIVEVTDVLWRVHRSAGSHVAPWNVLRSHGPIRSMRWDPQPPPIGDHPGNGVMYAGVDLATVLAEVYQGPRTISLTAGAPVATSWSPTRPLRVLDLTGLWPIQNGAASSLMSALKSTCRNWAAAIRLQNPHLDGVLYNSAMTGRRCVTLFQPSGSSFPAAPDFSRPLAAAQMRKVVKDIATHQIKYRYTR